MKTQTKALCSACGKETIVKRKTDRKDGIEHTYFKCQKCGHKSTVCYTDEKIRRALKEQQQLFNSGDTAEIEAGATRLQTMLDDLRERLGKTG